MLNEESSLTAGETHTECQVGRGAEKQAGVFNKPKKKNETKKQGQGNRERNQRELAGVCKIAKENGQGKKLRHNSTDRG